jgi:hypothetical protein
MVYQIDDKCYGYDYITNPVADSREDTEIKFLFEWDKNKATDLNSSGVMRCNRAVGSTWIGGHQGLSR